MALTYAFEEKDNQFALNPVFAAVSGANYAHALAAATDETAAHEAFSLAAGQTSNFDRIANLTNAGQITQAVAQLAKLAKQEVAPPKLETLAQDVLDRAAELQYSAPDLAALETTFDELGLDLGRDAVNDPVWEEEHSYAFSGSVPTPFAA